jgi:hypothetical protein
MRSLVKLTLYFFVLTVGAVAPATSWANVFSEKDVADLVEVGKALQALEEDVTLSLRSLSIADVSRVQSFAHLEVTVEAVKERFSSVIVQVLLSTAMESQSDEFRILNLMYGETLQKANVYLGAKRKAVLRVATALPNDRMFISYSERAAYLIGERVIPALERLQRILDQSRSPS